MDALPDDEKRRPQRTVSASHACIDEAIKRCEENRWRLTPIRLRAIELMCQSERPLKAYELLHVVSGDQRTASPMRVYRALDFLTTKHFVRHLKSINAFVWCASQDDAREAPFFICDQCGTAKPLSSPDVGALLRKRAAEQGFQAEPGTMEIHGLCEVCSPTL